MSISKLTIEDSKVSEILQALLKSNVAVRDVEVTVARPNNKACVIPYGYIVELDPKSSTDTIHGSETLGVLEC